MFKSFMSPRSMKRQTEPITPSELGKPLRLVSLDESGKFVMDPDAVAALRAVKGPLAVVSVCGRARQGKSYILNQVFFVVSLFHNFSL